MLEFNGKPLADVGTKGMEDILSFLSDANKEGKVEHIEVVPEREVVEAVWEPLGIPPQEVKRNKSRGVYDVVIRIRVQDKEPR